MYKRQTYHFAVAALEKDMQWEIESAKTKNGFVSVSYTHLKVIAGITAFLMCLSMIFAVPVSVNAEAEQTQDEAVSGVQQNETVKDVQIPDEMCIRDRRERSRRDSIVPS